MATPDSQLQTQNQDSIKYFISVCDEPIPDISDVDQIFSTLRFYFNDPELTIFNTRTQMSIMHEQTFQPEIDHLFNRWKETQQMASRFAAKEKSIAIFENFIAFIEYWMRQSSHIRVDFQSYTDVVSDCVAEFMQNRIQSFSPNKPFQEKLKQKIGERKGNQSVAKSRVEKVATEESIERRLQRYFNYFAKVSRPENHCTFDQLQEEFVTLNMTQWVQFIRKVCTGTTEKKTGKNASKVSEIKKTFDRYCSNSKKMNFQSFQKALIQFFKSFLQLESDEEAMNEGRVIMKLNSEKQFKEKLRELGAFVSEEVTIIQRPLPMSTSKKVKPKYMEINSKYEGQNIERNSYKNSPKLASVKVSMGSCINTPKVEKRSQKLERTQKVEKSTVYGIEKQKMEGVLESLKNKIEMDEGEEDVYLKKYYNNSSSNLLKRLDDRMEKFEAKNVR